ncbi:MAG TPA: hypothetical protein VIY47_02010 [Ignavibacteriaceae bacterium]
MPEQEEISVWLRENASDYIASKASITFFNDHDAMAFTLKFGGINATYNPSVINRPKEDLFR